mgnify:CR=1 FL=1
MLVLLLICDRGAMRREARAIMIAFWVMSRFFISLTTALIAVRYTIRSAF